MKTRYGADRLMGAVLEALDVVRPIFLSIISLALLSSQAKSADCFDPIVIPPEQYADKKDQIQSLQLRFTPITDTVCLPTRSGCTNYTITRVVIDIISETPGAYPVGQYVSTVQAKQGETCSNVPSWLFGDCGFSKINANMIAAQEMRGDFTLHLEKWASGAWICCKWFKCRRCEWKTRLWERSFDGYTTMPLVYSDVPPTNASCPASPSPADRKLAIPAHTEVDTSINGLERFIVGSAFSVFGGLGFLTGAVLAEPVLKGLVPMLDTNLPDQRIDIDTPDVPLSEISDVSVQTLINNYFCDLKFKRNETAFVRQPNGGFFFRMVRGRNPDQEADRKQMPSQAQFCSIIRPMLENQFAGAPPFAPTPPTPVVDIGTQERRINVKRGDSLWKIAESNYKNGFLYYAIAEANHISNSRLSPGQELVVPPFREILAAGYLISKGDNLWRVSRHYTGDGINYRELVRENRNSIRNPNLIYAARRLKLPSTWTTTPQP
ncbi:LysM repeat protein [Bradyrhizobium diazoefficiens]